MDMTLCFTHSLASDWSFTHNWGTELDGEKPEMVFYNTLCFGYNFSSRWSAFIENYNYFQHNRDVDRRLDGGITYDASANIRLDISGGIGLSEISPDYFISTGISFRFVPFAWLGNNTD